MNTGPNTINSPAQQIERFIAGMPSLPATAARVLELCNDLNTSPDDLNRVITLDPVLTGHVLKLVNSAYFSFSSQVTTIPRAIIMLGMNTIKNLVLSTVVLNGIANMVPRNPAFMDQFWFHSVCTGVAAKQLAIAVEIEDRERYFVGGLLHDLGKIPLIHLFPVEYGRIIETASTFDEPCLTTEKRILGMNHARVGGIIARKWKLGDVMTDCLEYHHEPGASQEKNRMIVRIIALANLFSNFLSAARENGSTDKPGMKHTFENNGFPGISLESLEATVSQEIEKARIFLDLTLN